MSETRKPCPLCSAVIRREEKADPDRSADTIDCPDCGIYEIGWTERAKLESDLRDEPYIKAHRARIRATNALGFVFRYPDGARIPHPWAKIPTGTL